MISSVFPKAVFHELGACLVGRQCERVPEPSLAMDDETQVEAFFAAGGESGALSSIYYFNALQISALIQPGDLVIDLGCGPANQLAILASLNPNAEFLGLDLAPNMLARAEEHCTKQGVRNVRFAEMDITRLDRLQANSADVVYSTLALHHLPNTSALDDCFAEVKRVLKPRARLFLHDLARPRSSKAIETLALQYEARQPSVFTEDYRNSLAAAFLPRDFQAAAERHFGRDARLCVAPLLRFMMVLTVGPDRPRIEAMVAQECRVAVARLEPCFRGDHAALQGLFAIGGLPRAKVS